MPEDAAPKERRPIEVWAEAEPVKLGSMLFTVVEPHRGHEVAYNRWYERDHFYAGCMVGPYNFAGRRFVATAELISRITNPQDHETAFLFGDGAGAAILTRAKDGHRLHRMSLSGDAEQFTAIQRTGGGARKPWPDVHGDLQHFYIQMDGVAVFKHAVIGFVEKIEETLTREKLRPEDIDWVVPHQANARILRAVSKRVGIPYEKFVVTIAKYGNTSAASVSMALGWAAEEGIFTEGDRIIFCSVGAGLTFAGGLLVW